MPLAETLYALLLAHTIKAPAPGWSETTEERNARLRSIAEDAAFVAKDVPEDALLILGVAEHESGFEVSVDKGPCYRGKDGTGPQCDSGRAACMMQILASSEKEKAQLFADRRYCFAKGLKTLKSSQGMCLKYGEEYQFGAYAAGDCERGLQGSRELLAYWRNWLALYGMQKAKETK